MTVLPRGSGRGRAVLAASILSAVALSGCAGKAAPEVRPSAVPDDMPPERVIAEVNGRPIVARRLQEVLRADRVRLGSAEQAQPQAQGLLPALDLVISGELLVQAARAGGMQPPPEEVDLQLLALRTQFASPEEFETYLTESGLDEESLKADIERRLLMEAYASRLTDELEVDETMARRIYDDQEDRFVTEEQVRAAQIFARIRPGDPQAKRWAARKRLEQAYRRAVAGEDFATLADEFAISTHTPRGGDLGLISRGQTLPDFEEVVFGTPVGEVTPPFQTASGYHVVKVTEHRDARVQPFDQVKLGLMMVLAREERDRTLRDHVSDLRRDAEIVILDERFK